MEDNREEQHPEVQRFRSLAENLASCEVCAREYYAREKKVTGPLKSLLRQREELLEQAEDLQDEIREFRSRRFWFEVPFDIQDPLLSEKNPHHYPWRNRRWPNGRLIETRRFSLEERQGRFYLDAPSDRSLYEASPPCSEWLTNPRLTEDLILLYMDREFMEERPTWIPLMRGIYDVEQERYTLERTKLDGSASMTGFAGRREDWAQAVEEAWRNRQEKMDQLDRALNFLATGIPMDERTKALFGYVSPDEADYWVLNRTIAYYDTREQYRQMYRAAQRASREAAMAARGRYLVEKDQYIRFAEVAQAGYLDVGTEMRLVLLFIPIASTRYCEVRCSPSLSLDNMDGRVYSADIEDKLYPDTAPLLRFFAQAYAGDLPYYDVLEPRPKNMKDDQWRIWAEARWRQVLLLQPEE